MSIHAFPINEAYKSIRSFNTFATQTPITQLTGARNSTVSFQVIISTDTEYYLNIGTAPWFSHNSKRVGIRQEVAVTSQYKTHQYIEGFVTDDDGIQKADILLSKRVIEEMPDMPSVVFVDIDIPSNALVGDETVTVKLYKSIGYGDEELAVSFELPLRIKEYVMPKPEHYSFYLDLWQHNSNIARKHEVALWSDSHFEIIEKYLKSLASLGQKSMTIVASEIPWRGQSCFLNQRIPSNLFEYSMIYVTRQRDGNFIYDYSVMQRYIDLCTKCGINGDIEVFGLVNVWTEESFDAVCLCQDYPERILIRYYDEADKTYKYMKNAEWIKDYILSLEQYFVKSGQISSVRVSADEPTNIEKYRKSISLVREISPSFIFKTAINHAEFIGEFKDVINDFAPSIGCVGEEYQQLIEYKQALPDKHFLWYVCCGPDFPNTFIKSHLLESRFIGVFTMLSGLDGFLRWNYTVWPENPREDIRYGSFAAGDTNFVYPSFGGDVLLSLRYKNLKRGIEDFELLSELKAIGRTDIVEEVFKQIAHATNFSDYYTPTPKSAADVCSLSYDDYDKARTMMLDALA